MTLRLRLTLLTTLLVALVLTFSGVGLHLLLARGLYRGLAESLQQSASLLSGFMEHDEGEPTLQPEGEIVPSLSPDLVAVLLDHDGQVLDTLGRPPDPLPEPISGLSTQDGWRVWSESIQGTTLMTLRSTRGLSESLGRFDTSFLVLAPVAVLLAFGLGYLFAGRALRPVRRLTDTALDLATRRAWRERLPEPARRDEIKRLSQATNTLLTSLAEVIEREKRFTADAAHELRTPLTVLRGRLEQAAEKTAGTKAAKTVSAALTASGDLLELVEGLLLLARTEAGQSHDLEKLALDEVVFDVAETFRAAYSAKGIALKLELPEAPAWVKGNPFTLGLLVRNLLDNALKFTPTGSVVVSVLADRARVRLNVQDSGPGIPDEAMPHLYERFYQADVSHRQGGSGLGLALARSVALGHGGTLTARNIPEGGTVFTLELAPHL